MDQVRVRVPGTISNLCSGFDVIGMAVDAPYDVMELKMTLAKGIQLTYEEDFGLHTDPQQNISGIALQAMMDYLQYNDGFSLHSHKNIKPGSGLGSSAASAVGAVYAANQLLGAPFGMNELIDFALIGESAFSGSRHADNVAPCMIGGAVLIRDLESKDFVSLPTPDLWISLVHPQIEIKTAAARSILPSEIALKQAVRQWGNFGAMVSGFYSGDRSLIGRALHDEIVEPVRSPLIPGFDAVKEQSLDAGALGGGISGSGPTLFMFSETEDTALKVLQRMQSIYQQLNIPFKSYCCRPSNKGVHLI